MLKNQYVALLMPVAARLSLAEANQQSSKSGNKYRSACKLLQLNLHNQQAFNASSDWQSSPATVENGGNYE